MPCASEVGDADDDEKINQQKVVLFSVIGVMRELCSLRLHMIL